MGQLAAQNQMDLLFEDGRWGVDWSPSLIFPQMDEQTTVQMTISTPPRGNIYDRGGLGLAVEGAMVTVGVIPGEIQDEAALLNQLKAILGVPKPDLKASYANARIDWYVPLGQITPETAEANYKTLSDIPGIE
ncbi:NTF2-like N-terminal transpeptidase domain-containing protein, partial [Chloroflexota bacterium]